MQSSYSSIKTDDDLIYLGRENLQYLARFWKKRMEKFADKRDRAKGSSERDDFDEEVRDCHEKYDYLKKLTVATPSKPLLFEKTIIRIGSKVTCFISETDRYISGSIVKINYDEELETGTFVVRVYDKNVSTKAYDYVYTPDGLSLVTTDDFKYYCDNPDYFRFTLRYRARSMTPTESVLIERMLRALPDTSHDSPSIA